MMAVKRSRKEADRLSDLPESLQLHILSFLDARHAVQTMLLSKSWVSTWASTLVLNFSSHGFKNLNVFDKFVVDTLSRRRPVKLDRLTFNGEHGSKSVKKVFDYAFSHGVQELEANIKCWPIELHTSSDSLTSLTLLCHYHTDCWFLRPRLGSFKNLTSLHLSKAILTDLDPFSRFPELDKLRLDFCFADTEGNALIVHAPKLLESTISCYNRFVNRYEFTTPKLRYFEWRGRDFPHLVTHEGGFPILDTVVIDYNGYYEDKREARKMFDDLLMLFNTLHNARSLTLFSSVVHLLTLFPLEGCSPFPKLKCLKLDIRSFWNQNLSMLGLLKLVPGLKAYLLPDSDDAKCSVMITDGYRPQAISILHSVCVVN